jgi:cytochrome c-type biogenesis protein CcmH
MVWAVFAVLTAFAALCVLVPMARAGRVGSAVPPGAPDAAIYADQLAELDRDVARGLVPVREAEAARAEIGRRLIRAAHRAGPDAAPRRWPALVAAALAIVGLPVLALALYGGFGAPALPDLPLTARQAEPANGQNIEALVARVESHLAQNPDDGEGWAVLAPVYLRAGRYGDAADAFANAIRASGATADLEAGLGEALTGDAGGVVTADARAAFERASALDPAAIRPRFFLAVALGQDGKTDAARAAWTAMIDGAAGSEAWLPVARAQLAALGGGSPAPADAAAPDGAPARPAPAEPAPGGDPSAADVEAAGEMSAADRAAMIGGMVERLSARLASEGGSVDDWLRLVRSYVVLGRNDEARTAVASAKAAHPDAADVRRIDEAASGLGLAQ